MADNSLDSLLVWMKTPANNVMWEWDAIAALARNKTNTLLAQEYIARYTAGSYLPPVSGEVESTAGVSKEDIHGFILDAPRLSFENASLDNSRAALTCSILGGIQLSMLNDVDIWVIHKVVEIDPLQGPKLRLDLNLANVPGNVETDGRVRLDLNDSDNFILTYAQTEKERRLGGDFFKDLFNKLDPEDRIWTLGSIAGGGDELMRPQSFKLRTQANPKAARDPRSSDHGDGALLIFICMVGGKTGGGVSDDYRYLIPDDAGGNYSASVLFDSRRSSVAVLLESIATAINSRDFIFEYSAGKLMSVTAQSGGLVLPATSLPLPAMPAMPGAVPGQPGILHMPEMLIPADSDNPLKLVVEDSAISVSWISECVEAFTIEYSGFDPIQGEIPCRLTVRITYQLREGPEGVPELYQSAYSVLPELLPVAPSAQDWPDDWAKLQEFLLALALAAVYGTWFGTVFTAEILARLQLAFLLSFNVRTSVETFFKEHIKLNFGHAIEGDTIRAPRDIGFFGRINPTRTSFMIDPLEPMIIAGGRQQFTVAPDVGGITWSVEDLLRSTRSSGTISPAGLYTAPAGNLIEGRFTRVRVTATDSSTGYYSSALVTVLVNELTINPLIQLCFHSQSVELAAGALGAGELRWSVKDPRPNESGEIIRSTELDGDHTYVAHEKVAGKTYVLDEIEVKSATSTRSAWVLVEQKRSLVVVKPLPNEGLPAGQIRLQAYFDDEPEEADWTLPLNGPGTIDRTGLYRESATATERFALIFVTVLGRLEGHIILPLPLARFPDELALMQA